MNYRQWIVAQCRVTRLVALAVGIGVFLLQPASAQHRDASTVIDLSMDVDGPCPSFIDLSGGDSRDCGRKAAAALEALRTVGEGAESGGTHSRGHVGGAGSRGTVWRG